MLLAVVMNTWVYVRPQAKNEDLSVCSNESAPVHLQDKSGTLTSPERHPPCPAMLQHVFPLWSRKNCKAMRELRRSNRCRHASTSLQGYGPCSTSHLAVNLIGSWLTSLSQTRFSHPRRWTTFLRRYALEFHQTGRSCGAPLQQSPWWRVRSTCRESLDLEVTWWSNAQHHVSWCFVTGTDAVKDSVWTSYTRTNPYFPELSKSAHFSRQLRNQANSAHKENPMSWQNTESTSILAFELSKHQKIAIADASSISLLENCIHNYTWWLSPFAVLDFASASGNDLIQWTTAILKSQLKRLDCMRADLLKCSQSKQWVALTVCCSGDF